MVGVVRHAKQISLGCRENTSVKKNVSRHRLICVRWLSVFALSCAIITKKEHIKFFQHTAICNCSHLLSNRPVTGMTGCAALPHNENEWHDVKNGRLFERSEFCLFSQDGHSQRNGYTRT